MDDVEFCPDHGAPEKGVLWRWPCPDDCDHLARELTRRLEDMKVKGNFVRMTVRRGVMLTQEFRGHEPVSGWEVLLPALAERRRELRRLHQMYRARRR